MIKRPTTHRRTLMALVAGLLVGLSGLAHAQDGINWAPLQVGMPPSVDQYIVVAPGDYILQPGIPGCGDHRDTRFSDSVNVISSILLRSWGWGAVLARQGGAFTGWFVTQFQQEAAKGTSGSIAQFASDMGASPRYATCGTAVLVAPAGWHFIMNSVLPAEWNQTDNPATLGTSMICNVPSGQEPYVKCHAPDAAWMVAVYPKYVVGTFINWARETRIADLSALIAPDQPY
jgi:hypothetical protein